MVALPHPSSLHFSITQLAIVLKSKHVRERTLR